jgi:anti-anti-sigma factor
MSSDLRPIRMKWTEAAVVLTPSGELDLVVADDLDFTMRELASSSARHIVIDLSELDFMDAAGLRALLRARDTAAASGRTLAVVHPRPAVARIFDMTGTTDLLTTRA